MKINIICVGNLKEQYWVDACKEYVKRISRFCKIEIIEVAEEKLAKNENAGDIAQVKNRESENILQKLKGTSILLDVQGASCSSEEFARNLESKSMVCSTLNFIIGGSYGVSESVKNAVKEHISFSRVTFPHQLMRVVLLEQLYRAFTINNHITYHK